MFSDIILNENETYEHLFGVNENTDPEDKSLEDILHDKQDDIDESCSNKESYINNMIESYDIDPLFKENYITEAKLKDTFASISKKLKGLKITRTKEQRQFDKKVKYGQIFKKNDKYYEDKWFGNVQDYTPGMTKTEFEKKANEAYKEIADTLKKSEEYKGCEFYIAGIDYIDNTQYPENSHWFAVVNYHKPVEDPSSIKEESCNESVISLPGTSHDYTIEASYEDYLADKIYNEQRLNMIISKQLILSESTGIAVKTAKLTSLYEAKLGDNIKNGWQKFLNFIKNTAGKFMEAMTKLLLDEKGYLEKYKDIILKKRPKDIDYSYTGDYQLGAQRITTVELPIFNYESYKNELSQESDGPLVQKLVKDFKYNDADSLADQLKEYFLGGGDQKEGKFESLNFQTMYNFCYDFNKIKNVVDKDINHLESSTQAINQAIQNKIKDNAAEAKQDVNKPTDQTSSNLKMKDDTSSSNSNLKMKDDNSSSNLKMKESALLEAEDGQENKGLQIDTSKISQASGSYENRDSVNTDDDSVKSDINKASTESSENIDKMINKWIRVCRTIITAKWTASQQIAKDYMTIIRTHVRSYIGTKDDKADNRGAKQTGDTYKKDGQKQQTEEQNK